MERVQKILATAGIGSRRRCEQLIREERVVVNGKIVRLGEKADARDNILVDGKSVLAENKVYIILNKPPGYICSMIRNEHGAKTITRLIHVKERVFPVGRLDKKSQGLVVLTNDGELANKLMHPSFNVEKEYLIWLAKSFKPRDMRNLREIIIQGRRFGLKSLVIETKKRIKLIIHEGRKHIIREAFYKLGYKILRLKRTRIGRLELRNVKQGTWRFLSKKELALLRNSFEVFKQHARPA